MEEPTPYP
jgi:hypothetical protein